MAQIKFNILSKSNPSNLNIRFYHGRSIDCNAQSNILIDPKLWSNKLQNLKPSSGSSIKKHYQEKISQLTNHIIISFNDTYANGKIINSTWLKELVNEYYKRPNGMEDSTIFFTPFVRLFIEESKTRINQRTGKKISEKTIKKYNTTLKRIIEFESYTKQKLRLIDIDLNFHKEFTTYLKIEENYSNTLIEKIISQLKTFIRDAKLKKLEVNPEIDSPKFSFKRDETIDTYLNNEEINIIYNLDLENEKLENVRDLFIIGLRTGLRISDLKRIHDFHFSANSIIISGTIKTDSPVEIPIHPQIKKILQKREQKLPRIISDQKFNEYVKELCLLSGFTQEILGYIKN